MFRKTLRRLTLLNAVIFIVLMGLLASAIFFYTQHVLYRSVNQSLQEGLSRPMPPGPMGGNREDFRIHGRAIWDKDKALLQNNATVAIKKKYIQQLFPSHVGQFEGKEVNGVHFRLFSKKVMTVDHGGVVIAAWTIDDEQRNLLDTLLLIIIIGWSVASILAFVVGYFLAKRALEPIKQAWDKQQQFVSDASHELRTPLSIIQTRIELLLKSPKARIQEKLKDISITLNESRRLSKLVSHLLTLARSDANRIEIEKKPVAINELLKQVYDQFDEMVSFQGKTLTLNSAPAPLNILGDRERLYQLLVILIDNAIKFTDDKEGRIMMTCSSDGHHVTITVADNGIGISKQHQHQVFDRFFQADTSRTDREGSGLGLSIAKWIVDQHAGKITIESELGEGTRFILSFPKLKEVNVLKGARRE
ncbi:two-component sensor histidine kinase [Pullulanibacillus camelliae]|uniref:histidine kinase n=1 Tax=Pullulanibacillus camelliae TaxID=1707096 RepID=A0A8J2VN42_9BACL|nr:HAMP domain-containing sensor histidine kinase [Pullulanibacillus camelliae]GGE33865.1 two-component sensor histidine kinase [Pullulanibacillus camelliae]